MAAVKECFCLAKDAGFKVVVHMMPDLPNVGWERDIECFREFFENPEFRTDGLKLYPTLVIRGEAQRGWWCGRSEATDGASKHREASGQRHSGLRRVLICGYAGWALADEMRTSGREPLCRGLALHQLLLNKQQQLCDPLCLQAAPSTVLPTQPRPTPAPPFLGSRHRPVRTLEEGSVP